MKSDESEEEVEPGRCDERDQGELEARGSVVLFHFLVLQDLGRKQS